MKDLLDLFTFISGAVDYTGNVLKALSEIDDTYCEDEVLDMFGDVGKEDLDVKKYGDVLWAIAYIEENEPELKEHIGYSLLQLRKFLFDAGRVIKCSQQKIDLLTNNNTEDEKGD